jgi:hypothetical protein
MNDFIYQEKNSKKNNKLYNANNIRLHWDIITLCNYNCEYSYARANKETWSKIQNIKIINNILNKIIKINKDVDVILLGGEPTMSSNYFYILNHLSQLKNVKNIGCISNGSIKNINTHLDQYPEFKTKFTFNLTFHPSQVKNIDDFINIINIIKKRDQFELNINIMLIQEFNEKIIYLLNYLVKNKINFYYNIPFDKYNMEKSLFGSDSYLKWIYNINEQFDSEKELIFKTINGNIFNLNDIDVIYNSYNKFKNWICDNKNFEIRVNDDNFYRMCSGEIFTINEINNLKELICPLENCNCQGLLSNSKRKIE